MCENDQKKLTKEDNAIILTMLSELDSDEEAIECASVLLDKLDDIPLSEVDKNDSRNKFLNITKNEYASNLRWVAKQAENDETRECAEKLLKRLNNLWPEDRDILIMRRKPQNNLTINSK